jgi:hypothetical protein
MFNITDNDQLYKVHPFRIERNEHVIWIDVYEHLNSTSDNKFYALPVDKPLKWCKPKDKHVKSGSTLEDTLNSCLASIAGLEHDDLFQEEEK